MLVSIFLLGVVYSNQDHLCSLKAKFEPLYQQYQFYNPDLPYPPNFLEPIFSISQVYSHHNHHTEKYIYNINYMIQSQGYPELKQYSISQMQPMARDYSIIIQRYGGNIYNHAFYWWILTNQVCVKEGPEGALLELIEKQYGSFQDFKKKFDDHSKRLFGSGSIWGCYNKDTQEIELLHSENEENPLMVEEGEPVCFPFMVIDLWEHASYLQFQWERNDYSYLIWDIFDWDVIELFFEEYASKGEIVPVS